MDGDKHEGFRDKLEHVVEEVGDLIHGSGHHQAGGPAPEADVSHDDHLNQDLSVVAHDPADEEPGVVEDETPA